MITATKSWAIRSAKHSSSSIPYMLVVGDRDVENGVVSVRSRKGGDLGAMTLDAFKEKILEEVKARARD